MGSLPRNRSELLRNGGGERIVLAVPVGPPATVRELRDQADEVVRLETPRGSGGVGQFHERFDPVSDEEAIPSLDSSA